MVAKSDAEKEHRHERKGTSVFYFVMAQMIIPRSSILNAMTVRSIPV